MEDFFKAVEMMKELLFQKYIKKKCSVVVVHCVLKLLSDRECVWNESLKY